MRARPLTVIGLNSGTSMDGIDAAVFRIAPVQIFDDRPPRLSAELLGSNLFPFDPSFTHGLKRMIAGGDTTLDLLCRLNFALGELFAEAALDLMRRTGLNRTDVDLIGSHGQTIWHAPDRKSLWGQPARGTLQVGEPAVIAARTGVTVIGDFRVQDLALGGQGAPLLSFADEVLFGGSGPLGILNLGGIANITAIDATGTSVMAFDTGPANMMIDRAVERFFKKEFDENGAIAERGRVDDQWLSELVTDPYFSLPPPKTTGREYFGFAYADRLIQEANRRTLTAEECVATITALTAASIANAYRDFVLPTVRVSKLVLGGGGAQNATLCRLLSHYWPHQVDLANHEDFGISTKFKESLLFALLAYTTHFGIPNNVPACTGASRRTCLGKICRP
jgi:anhydro-N-acetylmuramic acid kinase